MLLCPTASSSYCLSTGWEEEVGSSISRVFSGLAAYSISKPCEGLSAELCSGMRFCVPISSSWTAQFFQFPQVIDRPYLLFGHSLGSRIAFELALRCRQLGLPSPVSFIASGSRAPHLRTHENPIYDLPEAEFVAKLRDLKGTPEEVLRNEELIQLLTPLLRADFRIADLYCAAQTRLDCPIVVLERKIMR